MFDNPQNLRPDLTIQHLAEVALETEAQNKRLFREANQKIEKLTDLVQTLSDRCEALEQELRQLKRSRFE